MSGIGATIFRKFNLAFICRCCSGNGFLWVLGLERVKVRPAGSRVAKVAAFPAFIRVG
jgi:hypothetical protein